MELTETSRPSLQRYVLEVGLTDRKKLVPFHKDYDGLTDPLGEAGWG
jgi:hypothetical protein